MATAQATRFHQEKLDFNLSDLANHGINPSPRAAYWTREAWLTQNHGQLSGESMYSAIQKYATVNAANTTIEIEVYDEGAFAIVLVTDLMMRFHQELETSSEVVFVDATSHVDQLNTAVTPLLCAGPVGAVPLGIIFTASQDEISYRRGFQLLKRVLGDRAFYGKGHPDCFITDNSDSERSALQEVWPESELYLCIFHILQQVWRWLCDANHGVKKEERQQLMQVMKHLVYAESSNDFDKIWLQFCTSSASKQHDKYTRYLTKLVERREEWSIQYRAGRLLRGHHTNNFAEAAMCVIKDIILSRTKAYNTCQLVMLMNEVYDSYIKHRLLDIALCRKNVKPLRRTNTHVKEVIQINQFHFEVLSASEEGKKYSVDMQIGICDCPSGQTGAICKHQMAIADKYMLQLPQEFKNTPTSRQWLAHLALGRKPPLEFIAELQKNAGEKVEPLLANEETVDSKEAINSILPISAASSSSIEVKCEVQGDTDDDFVEAPPNGSQDSAVSQQPSETVVNKFVSFIKEMVKDYGDGETDVALERAMKLGKNTVNQATL